MPDKSNIDLKVILSFTDHYQNLYEQGEITEKQLNKVMKLLDNFENYSLDDFKNKIKKI